MVVGIAFSLAMVVAGGAATADGNVGSTRAVEPATAILPRVIPSPVEASYGDELVPVGDEVVCAVLPRGNLLSALRLIAESWQKPLATTASAARFTEIAVTINPLVSRSGPSARVLPGQGYLLEVSKRPHGVAVSIQGSDEAGAFYALQSLKCLLERAGGEPALRPAVIMDWPAFERRGLIMGLAPVEVLCRRLDRAAAGKLNLLLHCGLRPRSGDFEKMKEDIRVLKEFCDARYIEIAYLGGYGDELARRPLPDVLGEYEERYRAGLRSFTVNFDDMGLGSVDDARRVADQHASIANSVYEHLRALDPGVRVILCPVPYGGVPGRELVGSPLEAGTLYLKVMGERLPPEIPFFWTGDDGVQSETVTVQGAVIYGQTCGRKAVLWDNDALRFMNEAVPLSGREPGLHEKLAGYVANVNEQEARWGSVSDGVVKSIACYTWNTRAYDSQAAREYIGDAREIIRQRLRTFDLKEVLASSSSTAWEDAFDSDPATAWNSGQWAPGWIELVFKKPRSLKTIALTVAQTPAGKTNHQAVATFGDGTSRIVAEFQGVTRDQQVLRADIRPKPMNVTRLRILTTESPSWVAWSEIRIE